MRDFLVRTGAREICVRYGCHLGAIPVAADFLGRTSGALGGSLIEEKNRGDKEREKGTHVASRTRLRRIISLCDRIDIYVMTVML